MKQWYKTTAEGNEGKEASVVVEARIHEPSAWKREVLERASIAVSDATAQCMERVQSSLAVTMDEENSSFIRTADLAFTVDGRRAEKFRKLIAQPPKTRKYASGAVHDQWYTNAYRLVSCEPDGASGMHRAVSRLALGSWQERAARGKKAGTVRKHVLDVIPAKTGLKSVISYAMEDLLEALPRMLRDGVCQRVAEQVVTYLACVESEKVRGETSFPSIEDRDPARRQEAYERAINALVRDLTPIARIAKREASPAKYKADDPEGDKLIIRDDRWDAVMRSPHPRIVPLMFVGSDHVRIIEGTAEFRAGISKTNRHRGAMRESRHVRRDRPEGVRRKGFTCLRQWYAAVPLHGFADPPASSHRKRGLDMRFRKAPVQGGALYLQSKGDMLLLLSQKEDYFFRVLRRCDLRVGRCQILQKRGEWYLQLTLQMPTPLPKEPERVLGISFDLDAVATWSVLSLDGSVLETGALSPNEQIQSFLERKAALEWDQQKGRWVGGRRFSGELERIAHNVANQLLALAEEHDAALAVEEISYVQKASPDHEQNRLFSAWNFGQLSKILDYKSRMAGRTKAYASDYVTKLTCPACEAIGSAKDPPNKRATWRDETGALECRRCGRNLVVTPHDRARRAALHAIKLLRERKKRARKRAG